MVGKGLFIALLFLSVGVVFGTIAIGPFAHVFFRITSAVNVVFLRQRKRCLLFFLTSAFVAAIASAIAISMTAHLVSSKKR